MAEPGEIWKWISRTSILLPLCAIGGSSIISLIQILVYFFGKSTKEQALEEKSHVQSHGGKIIFGFQILRGLGCLASLALCGRLAVKDETRGLLEGPFERLCVAFAYACALSFFEITKKGPTTISYHLAVVLFTTWIVLFIRDLAPLCTYTEVPLDEGPLITGLICVQLLTSVIIPVIMPRMYVPLDPLDPKPPNPYQTAPLLSIATFSHLDSVIWKAYTVPRLTANDLPHLADIDHIKNLVKASFEYLDPHNATSKRSSTHIFFKLFYIFRKEYVYVALFLFISTIGQLVTPYGLKGLLTYLQTGGEGAIIRPWVWIASFIVAPLTATIAVQLYSFRVYRVTTRIEAIVTQLVLEHALRIRVVAETNETPSLSISRSSSGTATPGETENEDEDDQAAESSSTANSQTTLVPVVDGGSASKKAQALVGRMNNLITTDLQAINGAADFMEVVFSAPLLIIGSLFFLYQLLGWSVFVGFGIMVVTMPVPAFLARLMQKMSREVSKRGDDRIETVTETMSAIRMIKMFGWERRMAERVKEKRVVELKAILRNKLYRYISLNFTFMIPAITMAVTYAIYALVMKQTLDAATVFASISLFTILRWRMNILFRYVPITIRGKVSLERIADFLSNTELLDRYEPQDNMPLLRLEPEDDSRIGFRAASFAWSKDKPIVGSATPPRRRFTLHIEKELLFKEGRVNLILGPTGCGKTSLLMALLGEMHYIPSGPDSWFNLPRAGGVAYATQESWVMNATIRENILFGDAFDQERYDQVIYHCSLTDDLSLFDAGDLTEVGEKGLTLSGGQKARVTLARAIYSSAQIILLDDIFAALDVHTSKWIVEKCLKGELVKGRTVILVTHNFSIVAPVAEFVVSFGSNGRILSQGTMADALAKNPKLRMAVIEEASNAEKAEEEVDQKAPGDTRKEADGKLIVEEEVAVGHVSLASVYMYLSALGGRYPVFFWTGFITATYFECFVEILQPWILGEWATQYDKMPASEVNVSFYLNGYIGLTVTMIVVFSTAQLFLVIGALRASQALHDRLMNRILRTTLRWLDKTPTSRVITRCTQDVAAVDTTIPENLSQVFETWTIIVLRFISIVLFAPTVGILGLVVFILGSILGNVYIKSQLPVKREMSKAKAPLLAHFGAAVEGLASIRAYGAEETVKIQCMTKIDNYSRTSRVHNDLSRWVSIRIVLLGNMLAVCLAAYFVYADTGVSASNSGFILSLTVTFGGLVLGFVQSLNQFEVNGNSLERIQEYITIEQEKEWSDDAEPPAYWPSSGRLHVENLSARYSPESPEILHKLSFDVKSGEHIGVVGKTGSGKSTLTLSLFRCIPTEGEVYYDGIPTSAINLDTLREHITIIPQIPELLSGTLRQNLDPFDEFDDVVLTNALRSAGLYSLQTDDGEGRITLDSVMARGGGNLSVGQRQIVALGRAMLRDSKLLILDEATSAIDYKTDAIIQESLRKELKKDVTVITIAHRLQTIMDADKIMVLHAGKIVEFDTPRKLLEKKSGFLYSLIEESGDREALYAAAGLSATQF